jgi:hypothetical protein
MDAWQKALNRVKEKRNFKIYENYPEILGIYHDICEFGNIEQIIKAENILDNHSVTVDLIFNGKPDSEIVYESLIDILEWLKQPHTPIS